ncbi:MAG: hypothetical protein EPO16_01600 [Dehalococcoidia bacterium]|nr:MAG: hypothetical protein EPO16_01600 [Dehalococcoidia bacterium]
MALALLDGWHRPSGDVPLWRYLDVTRFALLLADREIYFARLALLDGFDCRVPSDVADTTYVSNWHQAATESMARWDAYAARGSFVALKTTLDRIQHALKDSDIEVTAGKVAYRDFALDGAPVDRTGLDGVLLYGRPALAHEQEVRLYVTKPAKQKRAGLSVRVDVPDLLDEVIVSPRADLATLRAVRALGTMHASKVPVRPSTLLDPPAR